MAKSRMSGTQQMRADRAVGIVAVILVDQHRALGQRAGSPVDGRDLGAFHVQLDQRRRARRHQIVDGQRLDLLDAVPRPGGCPRLQPGRGVALMGVDEGHHLARARVDRGPVQGHIVQSPGIFGQA